MRLPLEKKDRKQLSLTIAGGIVLLALIIGLAVLGSYRAGKQQEAVRQKQQEETQKEEQEQIEAEDPYKGDWPPVYKEEEEETIPRIKTTEEGQTYTPYASSSKWKQLTDEQKEELIKNTVPVLEDWNKTIERICTSRTNAKVEAYSYTLATFLHTFCEENGIQATEGYFWAYAGWVSNDEEDVYIVLNDDAETVLLARAIDQGRTWKFEIMDETKEELLKKAQQNENAVEPDYEG